MLRFDYQRLVKEKKLQNNVKVEKGSQETNPLKSMESWQMSLIKLENLIAFRLSNGSKKRAKKAIFLTYSAS